MANREEKGRKVAEMGKQRRRKLFDALLIGQTCSTLASPTVPIIELEKCGPSSSNSHETPADSLTRTFIPFFSHVFPPTQTNFKLGFTSRATCTPRWLFCDFGRKFFCRAFICVHSTRCSSFFFPLSVSCSFFCLFLPFRRVLSMATQHREFPSPPQAVAVS